MTGNTPATTPASPTQIASDCHPALEAVSNSLAPSAPLFQIREMPHHKRTIATPALSKPVTISDKLISNRPWKTGAAHARIATLTALWKSRANHHIPVSKGDVTRELSCKPTSVTGRSL